MSSNEDDYNDGDNLLQGSKKRRIQRACDICRRKKIRCDGVQMPGDRCSNCIAYNFDCTYVEAAKKRGPPKGYVEGLETRLEKLERLLRRLCPDGDILKDLDASLETESLPTDNPPTTSNPKPLSGATTQGERMASATPCDIATSVIRRVGSTLAASADDPPEDDFDFVHLLLSDNLKRLSIDPPDYRFFGKSSGAMLIQTAIELKNEYTGGNQDLQDLKRTMLGAKRPEFWTIRPWEQNAAHIQRPIYVFPDEDLILELTELYFTHVNLFLPLLHRPTFQKAVSDGLHLTNDMFGAILLLVCAVGSRYSDDPRILLDGVDSYHSCGWKWFDQVQMVKKSLLAPPSLYDLQFYCLSVQFLQGSSAPQSCWTMVGIGIRLAQDVGAHRRKSSSPSLAPEDEMWKRAFWVLVCMDRMVSSALGRPCAIQDEDFDLDLPIECDDEYWDHPDVSQRFKQPPNKPCLITAFNLYLRLNQVLAFSLRTIYSINKSKILLGFVGQQWEQHMVAELDSALNKWVDSVPDHLRWDPGREDVQFFNQSASLYCTYYHIQILIHRPFIPSPRKPSPLSFPSLAICTNAARSCSHIVDIQRRRSVGPPPQGLNLQMSVFTAGIVLLLNIWGGKRSGLFTNPNKEMADVYKCMQVLRGCEQRWHSAGRLWDILYELASVGDLPLPQSSPPATNKRERDADSPASATLSGGSDSPSSTVMDAPRNIAGSRRVTRDGGSQSAVAAHQQQRPQIQQQPPQAQTQPQVHSEQLQPQELFTLPVYSDELGRLPLHGQVEFSAKNQVPLDQNQSSYWYPSLQQNQLLSNPSGPSNQLSTSYTNNDMSMTSSFPVNELVYEQMGMNYASPYVTSPSGAVSSSYQNEDHGRTMHLLTTGGDPQHQIPGIQEHPAASNASANTQAMIDSDTIAMWSNAPTGFELDDWGTYLSNVSELTQGFHHTPGGT